MAARQLAWFSLIFLLSFTGAVVIQLDGFPDADVSPSQGDVLVIDVIPFAAGDKLSLGGDARIV
jgi:hypothetical protein